MQLKQLSLGLWQLLKSANALGARTLSESFVMLFQRENTESPECANPAKTVSLVPRYQGVFSDFDYDYIALGEQLPEGWHDSTWGNNTGPSFSILIGGDVMYNTCYTLWFDYEDPHLSEHCANRLTNIEDQKMYKYTITSEVGDVLCESNNWDFVKKFIIDGGVQNYHDNEQERRATDTDG